jgi:hypothetical protein
MSFRKCEGGTVAITNDIATTGGIDIGKFASGEVVIPTGSGLTSLTYYIAYQTGGTYTPAYDAAAPGVAIAQTVAQTRAYPIPASVFGAALIKMVGNTSGTIGYNVKT